MKFKFRLYRSLQCIESIAKAFVLSLPSILLLAWFCTFENIMKRSMHWIVFWPLRINWYRNLYTFKHNAYQRYTNYYIILFRCLFVNVFSRGSTSIFTRGNCKTVNRPFPCNPIGLFPFVFIGENQDSRKYLFAENVFINNTSTIYPKNGIV